MKVNKTIADLRKKLETKKFDTTQQPTTLFWVEFGEYIQDDIVTPSIPKDSEYVFDDVSLFKSENGKPKRVSPAELQKALDAFNADNPYKIKGTKTCRTFGDEWIRKCANIERELGIEFISDMFGLWILFCQKFEKVEKKETANEKQIRELQAEVRMLLRKEEVNN